MQLNRAMWASLLVLGFAAILQVNSKKAGTPPELRKLKSTLTLNFIIGDKINAVFECRFKTIHNYTIAWFFNDTKLTPSKKIIFKKNGMRLAVKRANDKDIGKYKCVVSNQLNGLKNSREFTISISPSRDTGLPKFEKKVFAHVKDIPWQTGTKLSQLPCSAEGEKPLTYKWVKDGKPIPIRALQRNLLTDTDYLRLQHLTFGDSGKYTCIVSNRLGTINVTYTLNMLPHSNYIDSNSRLLSHLVINAPLRSSATLQCIVPANRPMPGAAFYYQNTNMSSFQAIGDYNSKKKPNRNIKPLDGISGIDGLELQLINLQESDFGIYKCSIKSGDIDDQTTTSTSASVNKWSSTNMKSQKGPKFRSPPRPSKTVIGWPNSFSKDVLSCEAFGASPLIYTWFKDGKEISPKSSELSLANPQPIHSGDYKCTVNNTHGSICRTFKVYVPGDVNSKPILDIQPIDTSARLGNKTHVRLECAHNLSTTAHSFRWLKNAHGAKTLDIGSDKKTQVMKGITNDLKDNLLYSYLNFKNVEKKDFGHYACCVDNKFGVTCAQAELSLAAAPSSDNLIE